MGSVRDVTDLPALEAQIADLEQQSAAPDLWDDQEKAQQVTSAPSRAKAEHDRIVGMDQRIEDLEVLVQMGQEEGGDDGADVLAEAEAELAKLRKAVGELEVRTLLSGEYDEREAVVTIRAGAGGVDAADFAEMLMRMYLRWAERHGYPTKVMDTSYAEEAGLKSVTFEVNVPYAYGNLSVEGGTHRLVRISPFDNQGRRQTSFAAVEVIPLIEGTDSIEISMSISAGTFSMPTCCCSCSAMIGSCIACSSWAAISSGGKPFFSRSRPICSPIVIGRLNPTNLAFFSSSVTRTHHSSFL